MPKLIILTLLIASFSLIKAHAQISRQDSVVRMAYEDARKFRLDKKDLRVFRQNRKNFSRKQMTIRSNKLFIYF